MKPCLVSTSLYVARQRKSNSRPTVPVGQGYQYFRLPASETIPIRTGGKATAHTLRSAWVFAKVASHVFGAVPLSTPWIALRSIGQTLQVGAVLRGSSPDLRGRRTCQQRALRGGSPELVRPEVQQHRHRTSRSAIHPVLPVGACSDPVVAGQECNFEPNGATFVASVPVLVSPRTVRPTLTFKELGKPTAVVIPHRDVDVPVRSRHRPAWKSTAANFAKEPVGDAVALKHMVEFAGAASWSEAFSCVFIQSFS